MEYRTIYLIEKILYLQNCNIMMQQEQKIQGKNNILNENKRTPVSFIKTSVKRQAAHNKVVRGNRSDTRQMNIHVKTLNKKYLKKSILANEIPKTDKSIVEAYKKMKPNFQATDYLFNSLEHQTKQKCRKYYKSADIVKDIISSDRMFFMNKLIMLKFMHKIQASIDAPNISWKAQYFHKNAKQAKRAQKDKVVSNVKKEIVQEQNFVNRQFQERPAIDRFQNENYYDGQKMVEVNNDYSHNFPIISNRQQIVTQAQYPFGLIYGQYGVVGHNFYGYPMTHRHEEGIMKFQEKIQE